MSTITTFSLYARHTNVCPTRWRCERRGRRWEWDFATREPCAASDEIQALVPVHPAMLLPLRVTVRDISRSPCRLNSATHSHQV